VTIVVRSCPVDQSSDSLIQMLSALGVENSRELRVQTLDAAHPLPGESSGLWDVDASSIIMPFSSLDAFLFPDASHAESRIEFPRKARSVFFHTPRSICQCETSLKLLLRDPGARLVPVVRRPADFVVSSEDKDVCGPLSGCTVHSVEETAAWGLATTAGIAEKVRPLIISHAGIVCLRMELGSLDIFMLLTSHLSDLHQQVESNLDVRSCLLSLAAPLMVLKKLLHDRGWKTAHHYANLIIDDPPLSLRYGFINFPRVYELACEHHASLTLAYIPYNSCRGGKKARVFFRKASDRIGLCMHGCYHVKSEFGVSDIDRLVSLSLIASERMRSFSERTGIPHSSIMVFPQGVFSSNSLKVLNLLGFEAAVNTELQDVSPEPTRVTVKDLLQPAVTSFDGFPLFLRRKISDGIENCAFDLLLGKPCLVVAHHGDFSTETSPVWNLVRAINDLLTPPEWIPLASIPAQTGLVRTHDDGTIELKVYASDVRPDVIAEGFRNDHLTVVKDERHVETIDRILVGGRACEWRVREGQVRISVGDRSPGSDLRIIRNRTARFEPVRIRRGDAVRAWIRRHLSEIRDNSQSMAMKR
jgi:hypothetical protein